MKLSQYECKVQANKLSAGQTRDIDALFREAKWWYNAVVTSADVFKFDYKATHVDVRLHDGTFETRELRYLHSQMKQDLCKRAMTAVKMMSSKKKKGAKVGTLKPTRCVNSIPLRQLGHSYKFPSPGRVKVGGIRGALRVRGIGRIPAGVEWANAKLLRRPTGLFIVFVVYQNMAAVAPTAILGCDLGVKTGLTFSNGIEVDTSIPISAPIKRAARRVSRSQLGSKNRARMRAAFQKAWHQHKERVKDTRNKILFATREYAVAVQDDNILGWLSLWGLKVQSNGVGAIKQGWKQKPSSYFVGRFVRTTSVCRFCGQLLSVGLDDRVLQCPSCGHAEPRDLSAARAIGFIAAQNQPAGRRPLPLETKPSTRMLAYLKGVPHIRARLVDEGKEAPRCLAAEPSRVPQSTTTLMVCPE